MYVQLKTFWITINICLTFHFEQPPQVSLAAHFTPLKSPPSGRVAVDVQGSPRHHAAAKDSQWVRYVIDVFIQIAEPTQLKHLCRERRTLEKQKSPNANEVLLTDHDENVYEGMASNFFAVTHENGSPTLVTASLDCVLLGTIMKIVLRVCDERNIPIKWAFPNLKDASEGKWEGCFISSKSYPELSFINMHLYVDALLQVPQDWYCRLRQYSSMMKGKQI